MTNHTKPTNQRIKTGELYVVYTGLSLEGLGLLCYGDAERTPRFYAKDRLDNRVGDLPVCESLESADERLGPDTHAVVVPLSSLMNGGLLSLLRPYEIRQWAPAQRDVEPDKVMEYVAKWQRENPPECKKNADRAFAESEVVFAHTSWIKRNPSGTLGELLEFLDSVRYEMKQFDGDELIADHIDELCNAALYLADFEDEDDDLPNFDYRMDNINEDIEHVEDLISIDGESFKADDLPTKDELLNRMRERRLAG